MIHHLWSKHCEQSFCVYILCVWNLDWLGLTWASSCWAKQSSTGGSYTLDTLNDVISFTSILPLVLCPLLCVSYHITILYYWGVIWLLPLVIYPLSCVMSFYSALYLGSQCFSLALSHALYSVYHWSWVALNGSHWLSGLLNDPFLFLLRVCSEWQYWTLFLSLF